MKKIMIHFISIFLLINTAFAQNYIPLAVENAQWLIVWDDPETLYPDYYYNYKIMGDTIINGINYKKVYRRNLDDINNNWSPPYIVTQEYLYGVVRDDKINSKVYAINFTQGPSQCPSNEEYLMFDFNLNIGDSASNMLCLLRPSIVTNIAEGYWFGGYRTVIQVLEDNIYYSLLLEGIGSLNGLFTNVASRSFKSLEVYCIGTDEECLSYYLNDIKENESFQKNVINLYPNPIEDELTIEINTMHNTGKRAIISISDLIGNIVCTYSVKSDEIIINLEYLNKGIYLLIYNSDSGNKAIKKIVKI